MSKKLARLGMNDEDYLRLGLKKDVIANREDGLHTSGKFGEYEWWYFDAKLEGGYSLVIIFYSQPVTAATAGFSPCVSFSLAGSGYHDHNRGNTGMFWLMHHRYLGANVFRT